MITTTHVILNTALLGSKKHPERNWPLIWGSIMPDTPMFFYFFGSSAKLVGKNPG
jgi:hypothetical protein